MIDYFKLATICLAAIFLPLFAVAAPQLQKRTDDSPPSYAKSAYSAKLDYHASVGYNTDIASHGPHLLFVLCNGAKQASIQGHTLTAQMDTGSTGLTIGWPWIDDSNPPTGDMDGSLYYKSHKQLRKGWTRNYNINFTNLDRSTTFAVASNVPVLVVGKVCTSSNGIDCDNGVEPITDPYRIKNEFWPLMGIGFNRGPSPPAAGATPKNPLLSITELSQQKVTMTDPGFNAGYIVTRRRLFIGITLPDINYSGGQIQWQKLSAFGNSNEDWRWNKPRCEYTLGNGAKLTGHLLVDTGINEMLVLGPTDDWKSAGGTGSAQSTNPTIKMDLEIPTAADTKHVPYSFYCAKDTPNYKCNTDGSNDDGLPSEVDFVQADSKDWAVNTGRHLLKKYNYIYDHRNGYIGFQARPREG